MAAKKKAESDQRARVVLLDSHAILHRAYHALPDFSSSKGEPTGALYGLVLMLLKIADELKPEYLIAARDLPGKTARHELFEEYKATRVKTDGELIEQLKRAPDVFAAFGIPVYAAPGYEADDVIGTIVKQLSVRKDIQVVIASGDMDTLQLVSPRTIVYTMRKGLQDTVLFDTEAVHDRYGFGPEHVVDYKALRGDPSDNIPGVKGIGEKTATELIQAFGGLEEIYRALENSPKKFEEAGIKPRVVNLLTEGRTEAAFSKKLATIQCDAPIIFELPQAPWRLADHLKTATAKLDELEFRALRERVTSVVSGEEVQEREEKMRASIDPKELRDISVAAWLLRSDLTNPTLDDIFALARTEDFERAREFIFSQLRATGELWEVYEKIERPLMPIIDRMREVGIYLDVPKLTALKDEYRAALSEVAGRVFKAAGHEFNISSPKQLGEVLFDELNIGNGSKQKKTATGARTTREEELQKLAGEHGIVRDVLKYRELQKLLGTYIEKMPALVGRDGRIHAEFLQAGTTTGRMASQNPNLQNIPVKNESGQRIREAFAAGDGYVLASIDYSQIELRIAAGLSGDERLIEVFKTDGDIHAAVASRVFGVPVAEVDKEMRRKAKVINFGILYGMGVNALRANLSEGGTDVPRAEAAQYLEEYFTQYEGLARFIEHTKEEATKNGYTETMFGRRRYFPGLKSPLPNMRAQAERMAINAPIQGTQADIIKLAMVEADKLIEQNGWRDKARLLLQVHDELVYELEASEAETMARAICSVMEQVAPTEKLHGVPIKAEIATGPNWGQTKKLPRA